MRRRTWLGAAGGLVVGFVWPAREAQASGVPGSLRTEPRLEGWLRIDSDGEIVVFTGKAELGQGLKTALLQIAAEELGVAPHRITLVTADTARTPDEGFTAGSRSLQDSGSAIRHAAAQARALLLARAAQRLGRPVDALRIDNGVVLSDQGSLAFGALVRSAALQGPVPAQVTPRNPALHTVVGRSLPRVDLPDKVCGGPAFVHDLRLPGMLHGRVLRPPGPRARLRQLDSGEVRRRPGVEAVVRDGSFVGVVAQREFEAVTALRALAVAAQWEDSDVVLPSRERLHETLLVEADSEETVLVEHGAPPAGGRVLDAVYRRPFLMHGSIGPSCAVAQFVDGQMTVWTHSQGVFPLRGALAELLGLPAERLRCIHAEGAGCYGHNGADDAAADAALLARALPGRPVRVQWMREDEHGWEPYGPPMQARLRATLDADGRIAAWAHEVISPPHSARPQAAGDLLAATQLAQPFAPSAPRAIPQPEGGGDRNAVPLYTLPALRVVHRFVPETPVRVSALRALGAQLNVFAIESFVDELALAANAADPVAFRLQHLADPRARQAIQTAADRFGWTAFWRGAGRGRGFAFARYKNLAAYAAVACEVEVMRANGALRVVRVVAAVDAGEAVSPDGIRNQIEGGIVQGISWATLEEVRFDASRVASLDWGGYPILRFPQAPGRVDVHVIDRPGEPYLGVGEAAQGPAAAAVANAIADATGVRVRELPLNAARLRAAFGP